MYKALCKSSYLYWKNFFTTFIQCCSLWDKWMPLKCTCQVQFFAVYKLRSNTHRLFICRNISFTCCKCCVNTPFGTQMFYIYFTNNQLLFKAEAIIVCQLVTIFIDKPVSGKDYIGSRFSESTGREYISRNTACRLLADKRTEVTVFTYPFIVGRKIKYDFSPL